MPHSLPEAPVLLGAVTAFLETDVAPGLSGRERYLMRVALNVLRIVLRELDLGPELEREDRAELAALLGDGEDAGARLDALIRGGGTDDAALRAYLAGDMRRALLINNPKWLDEPAMADSTGGGA